MSAWYFDDAARRETLGAFEDDQPSSHGRESAPPSAPPSDTPRSSTYLNAGQLVVSSDPCTITAILGSGVSVCIFDVARGAGGASHYVLPHSGSSPFASPRFGDVAVEELVWRMLALGCREADLRAKIFGGASILSPSRLGITETLGAKNIRLAKETLSARGIAVVAEETGGARGRKIEFQTDTGAARVCEL